MEYNPAEMYSEPQSAQITSAATTPQARKSDERTFDDLSIQERVSLLTKAKDEAVISLTSKSELKWTVIECAVPLVLSIASAIILSQFLSNMLYRTLGILSTLTLDLICVLVFVNSELRSDWRQLAETLGDLIDNEEGQRGAAYSVR